MKILSLINSSDDITATETAPVRVIPLCAYINFICQNVLQNFLFVLFIPLPRNLLFLYFDSLPTSHDAISFLFTIFASYSNSLWGSSIFSFLSFVQIPFVFFFQICSHRNEKSTYSLHFSVFDKTKRNIN